jgi:hypothetical protein
VTGSYHLGDHPEALFSGLIIHAEDKPSAPLSIFLPSFPGCVH